MVSSNIGAASTDSRLLREFSISVVKCFAADQAEKAKTSDEISLNATGDTATNDNGISILEVLSDGHSCIRYAKEIKNLLKVYATHSNEEEAKTIGNKVLSLGADKLIETVHETPLLSLYAHRKHSLRCHIVDLTQLTNVVTVLDAGVQCVTDGGLLLVSFSDPVLFTATDPAACYRLYGATNTDGLPESALRVALAALELHANRHGRVTTPIASKQCGDSMVVCVQLHIGPVRCKQSLSKTSLVYHCERCATSVLHALGSAELISEKPQRFKFSLTRGPPVPALCELCQQPYQVCGPVWNAELDKAEFTSRLAASSEDEPAKVVL